MPFFIVFKNIFTYSLHFLSLLLHNFINPSPFLFSFTCSRYISLHLLSFAPSLSHHFLVHSLNPLFPLSLLLLLLRLLSPFSSPFLFLPSSSFSLLFFHLFSSPHLSFLLPSSSRRSSMPSGGHHPDPTPTPTWACRRGGDVWMSVCVWMSENECEWVNGNEWMGMSEWMKANKSMNEDEWMNESEYVYVYVHEWDGVWESVWTCVCGCADGWINKGGWVNGCTEVKRRGKTTIEEEEEDINKNTLE